MSQAGGASVNLLPSSKPADVYSVVLEQVTKRVRMHDRMQLSEGGVVVIGDCFVRCLNVALCPFAGRAGRSGRTE